MKGNTMTYKEFQAYMANYGFIVCPMTREEYGEAFALGARQTHMFGIACDMNAGLDLQSAVKINTQR